MTKINLKAFYPWYTRDEYIEIPEEIEEELRADKRYEAAYRRRVTRNKAQYSLDCDDGIEYSALLFEPSPEELLLHRECVDMLQWALDDLPEKQRRRVAARVLRGMKFRDIATAEGVTPDAVSDAVLRGLANMRKFLNENW